MLWLFRLSVDSEDPGEERWEQIRQRDSKKSVPAALKTDKTTKIKTSRSRAHTERSRAERKAYLPELFLHTNRAFVGT